MASNTRELTLLVFYFVQNEKRKWILCNCKKNWSEKKFLRLNLKFDRLKATLHIIHHYSYRAQRIIQFLFFNSNFKWLFCNRLIVSHFILSFWLNFRWWRSFTAPDTANVLHRNVRILSSTSNQNPNFSLIKLVIR